MKIVQHLLELGLTGRTTIQDLLCKNLNNHTTAPLVIEISQPYSCEQRLTELKTQEQMLTNQWGVVLQYCAQRPWLLE